MLNFGVRRHGGNASVHGPATFASARDRNETMAHDTILIVEPNFTGHRWRYAQWAANAYMEAGYRCVIVTDPANAGHSLCQQIEAEQRPDLEMAYVAPLKHDRRGVAKVSYLRFFRDFRHAFSTASRGRNVALVVVPYVDYFFYALPFLGSPFGNTPWVGITMRASFHHAKVGVKAPRQPLVNAIKAQLFQRAIRTHGMKTLLSIDPTLTEWYSAGHATRGGAAVEYLADPFPDTPAAEPRLARERLGLAGGKHVLVYGAITERKGIQELVTALAAHADTPGAPAPTLVIAGAQDDETRAFLASALPRLHPVPVVMDRFITADEELDLFSACDAVWLGYKGHYGMSGVLVQAYRFAKPVIATADGLIGWFCRTGELGPVIDDLSVASINGAVDAALGSGRPAPNSAHLLERNTLPQFKQTLRQALR
jgi:glycosyltransferase involved in cell wall biosynthesis